MAAQAGLICANVFRKPGTDRAFGRGRVTRLFFFRQELSITAAKLVQQVKGVSGMTAVKETDGDRLEDLMRRYGDALVRMCCLYLNDASLAQDAAQDTFIKAWRNLGQFRGECDERTWLMRIAINTCRDYHRTAWLRHVDRGTPLEALPEAGARPCSCATIRK